jgi:hypothetical protein
VDFNVSFLVFITATYFFNFTLRNEKLFKILSGGHKSLWEEVVGFNDSNTFAQH